jgi:hypothetical protein
MLYYTHGFLKKFYLNNEEKREGIGWDPLSFDR